MGKVTGFMEYQREVPPARVAARRILDWQEFNGHAETEFLQRQGARCMDCGVPFCHSGHVLAGATTGCPLYNLIPEWNDLVYRGLWREALGRLLKTNDFPEFTGRVCPAPCEDSCVLGLESPPVTIKNIEYTIIERAFAEHWIIPEPPLERTGRKVAIVGSGPAGLSAAYYLALWGCEPTVFKALPVAGGMMAVGIPSYRLDKAVLNAEIDFVKSVGVEIKTKSPIRGASAINDLRAQGYQAGFLAVGAWRGSPSTVPAGSPRESWRHVR